MDNNFYFAVANFLLMITLFYFLLRRALPAFFRARSTNTRIEMEKVKKLYNEAYRKYEEIEAKLKNADVAGKKLLDSLKQEAELEKQRIIRKARESAYQSKFDSERAVKQEVQKAKESLRQETAELAARLAQNRIQASLSSDDQKNLAQEFLTELEKIKRVS